MTVTYDWATDATTIVSNTDTDLIYPVAAPGFVVITTLTRLPERGSAGIKVTDGANSLFYSVGPLTGNNVITPEASMTFLALEWNSTDTVLTPYCSDDGITWILCAMPLDEMGMPMPYPTFTLPTHAGLFFAAEPPFLEETVVYGSPRVLPGSLMVAGTEPDTFQILIGTETLEPIGEVPLVPPDPLTPSEEAIIHAFVGAPFGDLEFDVGKSVGWLTRFVDDIFVTDINRGTQRYWVVNWTKSFAHTYYKFSSANYFDDPEAYRQVQFNDATAYSSNYPTDLVYDDNDWVIFLDAHEGLSADTRSLPDDYLIEPYQSFLFREVARANAAGRDRIVFPFFVFLRHDHIQNVIKSHIFEEGLPSEYTFTTTQSCGVPYYLPYMGLTRMFKASALKNPAFDWSIIDTPVAVPDATVKMQIVSYAYAHWNLLEVPPGETTVPAPTAENDEGWKQRCIISQALPIPTLPVGTAADPVGTWVAPASDPAGKRGPWAVEYYADMLTDPVVPTPPPPLDPEVAGIRVPMYDLVFRLNVRDGVWYNTGDIGAEEVVWDETLGEFVPFVPA